MITNSAKMAYFQLLKVTILWISLYTRINYNRNSTNSVMIQSQSIKQEPKLKIAHVPGPF